MAKSKSFKSLADLKDIELFRSEKVEPPQKNSQSSQPSDNFSTQAKKIQPPGFPSNELQSFKTTSAQGTSDQEDSYQKRLNWINRREREVSEGESALDIALKRLESDRKSLESSKAFLIKEQSRLKNQLERISELDTLEFKLEEKDKYIKLREVEISQKEAHLKAQEQKNIAEINKAKINEKRALKESELANVAIKRQGKTLKEITAELKKTALLNKSLNHQLKTKQKDLLKAQAQVEIFESQSQEVSESPKIRFDNFDLIQFLIKNGSTVSQLGYPGKKIAICGDGPWYKKDFSNFLKSKEFIPVNSLNRDVDIAVIGRDFDEEEVEGQLIAREGKKIHFYSQELLLASIIARQNPLNSPGSYKDLLNEFAVDHPGLCFLMENFDFPWPLPNISDSATLIFYSDGLVEQSPLVSMGYHVGIERGLDDLARRKILSNSFMGMYDHLKRWHVESDEYMKRWGKPNSRRRLFQMSHHIHALIISRRSNPSMKYAVQDWKNDLKWLKKFYKPYMGFSWPVLN